MQTKRNGTETESKKEEGRNHIIIYGRKNPCRPMDGRDFFSADTRQMSISSSVGSSACELSS